MAREKWRYAGTEAGEEQRQRDIENGSLIQIVQPAVQATDSDDFVGGLLSCLQESETNVEKQNRLPLSRQTTYIYL
jgi:hypothetical protein